MTRRTRSSTSSTTGRRSSGSCSTPNRTTRCSPRPVEVQPGWLMRHDRIDFPPGGIAYRHTHPGPGIRYLLHGSIRIESGGETHDHGPGEPWFESGPEPVLATASATEDSAFVRVMLLPPEWAGKRTIKYVDPADEDRPKLQRPTVYGEYPIAF